MQGCPQSPFRLLRDGQLVDIEHQGRSQPLGGRIKSLERGGAGAQVSQAQQFLGVS